LMRRAPACGGRRGASCATIILALCAAGFAAFWAAGCADPYPPPRVSVELLSAWEDEGSSPREVELFYRVSVEKGIGVERWGIVLRIDSDLRRYWASRVEEIRLPEGASLTGSIRLGFATAEERYVAGSALVEESWFE
jgi:hypothetical protein